MKKGTNMSDQKRKIVGIVLASFWLLLPALFASLPPALSPQASSPLSLEDILKRLSNYEYGQNEGVLWDLRNYVQAIKDIPESRQACEEKLSAFLETQASLAAKMTCCWRFIRSKSFRP